MNLSSVVLLKSRGPWRQSRSPLLLNTQGCPQGHSLGCIFPQAKPTSVCPPLALSFPRNKIFCVCMAGGRFKKEIVVDGQSYLLLIDPIPPHPSCDHGKFRPLCFTYEMGEGPLHIGPSQSCYRPGAQDRGNAWRWKQHPPNRRLAWGQNKSFAFPV